MPARLLTGKEPASEILEELKPKVRTLRPSLFIVQIGDDPASTAYVKQKMKACSEIGMRSELMHRPEATFEELHALLDRLNADPDVTGYIVQLPLPQSLRSHEHALIEMIDPVKDVDGFTKKNIDEVARGVEFEKLPPATPMGIIDLLEYYEIPYQKKSVVIVGKGNVGGKLEVMLNNRRADVTAFDSSTSWNDVQAACREADILVSAVGKPGLITGDMIKEGAVVIDVGITRIGEKLKGDVDFDAAKEKAFAITPIPGGVGPMTIAELLKNCVRAAELQRESTSKK